MMSHCLIIFLYTMLGMATACTSPVGPREVKFSGHSPNYRIMFYNVENLFDLHDDTATSDEAFTPSGDMHWTENRYYHKINNMGKVILAVGGWNPPDIIGLGEIENQKVLDDLIHSSLLSKFPYGLVHYDSPDRRGIDVGLIYNRETVRMIDSKSIKVTFKDLKTRDILYFKALLHGDTCHFFVNHWPSRYTGQLETEKERMAVAGLLRHHCDSLFQGNNWARIIIMGDFNDDPDDVSISGTLSATLNAEVSVPDDLYNLSVKPDTGIIRGTLKYEGRWNLFDQIIVSGAMLLNENGVAVKKNSFAILHNMFLLEPDRKFNGYKPLRTYSGFKYRGGFSDHLPVYVDLMQH
jgi:hypothetical protein